MWAVAQRHPDVVKVLLAHGADVQARSKTWSQVMAVPPHGYLPYNKDIPAGSETALMFAARVGDLESAKLLVAAGANVNDADAWGVSAIALAAHSGFGDLVELLLDRGADANAARAGFSALHAAIMHRDAHMVGALLAHGADVNAPVRAWTPMRRSSKDFHFGPELVGATPFWLAARFGGPAIMRLLADGGAEPLIVHRVQYFLEGGGKRTEATTALMAAIGMGGGAPWVQPDRPGKEAREAEMLEAVKLALELGVDVNAANADGKTALSLAQEKNQREAAALLRRHGA
jgi:ankyrin repeat protein